MTTNIIKSHRVTSTDDVTRPEFNYRTNNLQMRDYPPSPIKNLKITRTNNKIKQYGYNDVQQTGSIPPPFDKTVKRIHEDIKDIKNHENFTSQQTYFKKDKNSGDRAIYERNTIDRFLEKYKNFKIIKNARHSIYFLNEEFYRLNIHDDDLKFKILLTIWPQEDISLFYRLNKREHRNFHTFCDFCENKHNTLSEILSKKPQYNDSTKFKDFFADVVEFAESSKGDLLKFFCHYLSPHSLKNKIKQNFGEKIDIFRKRTQVIWNAQQGNSHPLLSNYIPELRYASKNYKASFAKHNTETKINNICRNNAAIINNRQQNKAFNCTMLIPKQLKGLIIGRKGSTIKKISKNSKTRINIQDSSWKEVRVQISGPHIQCSTAINNISHLIRQTRKNYPLKIILDSKNIPHIIGKKGKFVRKIKSVSKASSVRIFSTLTKNTKEGVLIIKNATYCNVFKAAKLVLSKIRRIKYFKLKNSADKCKISKQDQNIRQLTDSMTEKVNKGNQTQKNTNDGVISEKDVENANYNCIINRNNAKKPTETNLIETKAENISNTNESFIGSLTKPAMLICCTILQYVWKATQSKHFMSMTSYYGGGTKENQDPSVISKYVSKNLKLFDFKFTKNI